MKAGTSRVKPFFTIGHSNRSFEGFLSLLKEFDIQVLADVRRYPGSRKFPHFNRDVLCKLLDAEGIQYVWFEALGGRRHAKSSEKSSSTGLENLGFRNYADHMLTSEFQVAVQELMSLPPKLSTAIMCAEKFYWKCHRRLLSDFLTAQGMTVTHIIEKGTFRSHKMTPGAIISDEGTVLFYR